MNTNIQVGSLIRDKKKEDFEDYGFLLVLEPYPCGDRYIKYISLKTKEIDLVDIDLIELIA